MGPPPGGGNPPPPGPPPPPPPPTNPQVVVKTPPASPPFSGSIRIQTFQDLTIETGKESEKKDAGSLVDMAKVEAAAKRVKGVTSFSYDASRREIVVGYSGAIREAKDVKIAIDGQALPNEILSPAKVIVRPMGKLENPDTAINAVKGVAGVVAAEQEYNDLAVYADLSAVSLESLMKAVEGSGVKCQISSHEEIKIKYGASGSLDALKNDLARTKWVLRVQVEGSEVKVLTIKGRLTKAVVKSIMAKHGFPEAQ
jgi:copper chaperone CopZ